jgi:tetratricopeptide (TPR) repeat protein
MLPSLILALVIGQAATASGGFEQARATARSGHGDEAVAQLLALGQDPRALQLLCTVYITMEKFDEGIRACEAAVSANPSSSEAQLLLARAYGAKADHSGAFTGMRLVGKIRGSFEKAVELDSTSVEALSDLGEFYVSAPGIVGGGSDKATLLVDKLMKLSPARGHRLLGMIAQKNNNLPVAEAEFQKEIEQKHSPESYVDLANFYAHQKQWEKASAAALSAIHHDVRHGADSIDAAKLLVKLNRELPAAEQAYRDYLAGSNQTAGTPAFKVHTLLGLALARQGEKAGAQREFAAALELAHDYPPARKGAQ